MCCPTDRFSQVPGLRLRPVKELGVCVVFAPAEAKLYRLNAQAWLVLALCREAISGAALGDAWRAAVAPEDPQAEQLGQAVALLRERRLLRVEAGEA